MTPAQLAEALDRFAALGIIPPGGIGVYPPTPGVRQHWDPTVHVDNRAHTTASAARWPREWWT